MSHHLLAFGMPGPVEWIIIGIVALLIFGRRLPDVARSMGKSIVEFKKGIKDVKDEIDVRGDLDDKPEPRLEQQAEPRKAHGHQGEPAHAKASENDTAQTGNH